MSPKTFGTKIIINCLSLYLPSYSVTMIDHCLFYSQNWKTKPSKKFFHYPQPTFLFCPQFLSLQNRHQPYQSLHKEQASNELKKPNKSN